MATTLDDYMQAQGLPSTGNIGLDRMQAEGQSWVNWAMRDPRVQQMLQSGGSGWVSKIPGTRDADVKIENGKIIGARRGGLWKPLLAAAGVAGGGMAAGALLPGATAPLGPTAAGGGTTAAAVPASLSAGGGAASLFKQIAQLAAPLAGPVVGALANRGHGRDTAAVDAQMSDLLELQKRRMARTEPVHEAAMRMAMSMAPTGNSSPRMAQAIQATNQPMAQTPINPQVSEAIQRLMAGRG
jgi:hypothetical protein